MALRIDPSAGVVDIEDLGQVYTPRSCNPKKGLDCFLAEVVSNKELYGRIADIALEVLLSNQMIEYFYVQLSSYHEVFNTPSGRGGFSLRWLEKREAYNLLYEKISPFI